MNRRGLTLFEVLVVLGLVVLVYSLMGYTTLQLARFTRQAQEAAARKARLIGVADQLRWQLRSLFRRDEVQCLVGVRTGESGRDELRFVTSKAQKAKGVVEVGYRIAEVEGELGLLYREFPYRSQEGLRPSSDQQLAPWKPLHPAIARFELEYSRDGLVWQTEWQDEDPPYAVRVTLTEQQGEVVSFVAIPGMVSKRW